MKEYTMVQRKIKLNDAYQVIIIGGGPAGCASAIAAAREGAKTLLIEATGCLGGMGTSGLVPAWAPFWDKKQVIYRGIAEKILKKNIDGLKHVNKNALDWVPIDPEKLKCIYDNMVTDSGANVLINTFLSDVDTDEDGNVTAIVVSNKAGLTAYKAKTYVDCTGDADVAAWAGAEFIKGDEVTGELQPATHCFSLANVNEYAYRNGENLHSSNPNSPIYKILKSKKYPDILDAHMCHALTAPGTVSFNAGHIWNVDNTDPESVSKALMKGRKIAAAMRDGLAEFYPEAFAGAVVASTGSLMGVRETRRITGDYVLTFTDYMNRHAFDDEIGRNCYYIDIHLSEEEREKRADRNPLSESQTHRYGEGESHGIPYRCLTPQKLKNVLVAGRSISCERSVQGSIRVMPTCLVTGEAAGVAAALVSKMPVADVHKLNVRTLRKRLLEEGCYLK